MGIGMSWEPLNCLDDESNDCFYISIANKSIAFSCKWDHIRVEFQFQLNRIPE